jgi:Flp pilus assembly protein TadG
MKKQVSSRRRRGVVLVETALVLVLLLMITLGAIEYGWLFMNMQRITNAARHGARIAAALDKTDAEGQTAMAGLVTDLTTATCTVNTAAGIVTATCSVPGADVSLIHWNLLPIPATLQATIRMAKEGS